IMYMEKFWLNLPCTLQRAKHSFVERNKTLAFAVGLENTFALRTVSKSKTVCSFAKNAIEQKAL
ncbi:MAG: hypothetical protein IJF10_03895, partial [Clostridia bacterium]|nr:hypothetical protein [Clostridia bacterium]